MFINKYRRDKEKRRGGVVKVTKSVLGIMIVVRASVVIVNVVIRKL